MIFKTYHYTKKYKQNNYCNVIIFRLNQFHIEANILKWYCSVKNNTIIFCLTIVLVNYHI